mgnify:CR=1 FL=1
MKNPQTIRAWAAAFWLAIWQLGSVILNRDSLLPLLVSPVQVLVRVAQLSVTTDLWASICFSLLRIATGFFLAAGLGILLAMLSARFHQVKDILAPVVLAVKTIPVASFIILVLILFSSRSLAALISFLMVLPIIYTNVLAGIEAADRQLEMAEVFLIPVGRRIRYIYLPQVIPFFRSGCMVALGLCWKSGIAAEVIGTPSGSIGEHLQQAKIYLDMPDLFAWTLVIVLVSLAFEKTVLALLSWTAKRLERM